MMRLIGNMTFKWCSILFYFDFEETDVVCVELFFVLIFVHEFQCLAMKKWFLGTLIYMVVRLTIQCILVLCMVFNEEILRIPKASRGRKWNVT
jgi:hypothetical protein